jgi:2,4-dienoyl-CoA reductase-like NADH-dependent reductase (Old Yellow Enzyme family)
MVFDDCVQDPDSVGFLSNRPSSSSLVIMKQRLKFKTLPNRFGYVTMEMENVGMAPGGINKANLRVYSTWARSGMGRLVGCFVINFSVGRARG